MCLIKKENIIATKNIQSYILILLIPIISIIVNIFMSQSIRQTIYIAIIENSDNSIISIFESLNDDDSNQEFIFINYTTLNLAIDDLINNKNSLIVEESDSKNVIIHYIDNRQDSNIASQYIINKLQLYISQDLMKNHSEEVYNLQIKQPYIIKTNNVIDNSDIDNSELNFMVYFALMWIIVLTPFSNSCNQIQQEKSCKSLFYLYKLPYKKTTILLAKQTAVIVQSVLSLIILILISKIFGITQIANTVNGFAYILLSIICISSLGFFFGLVINNYTLNTLITLILTLPNILVTGINTTTKVDFLLKIMPSYHISEVIRKILLRQTISFENLVYICAFTIIFYVISILIFSKKEPIKLCGRI